MSKTKTNKAAITNDLVWAAMIVATGLVTMGSVSDEQSATLLILQVVGWLVINSQLRSTPKKSTQPK